MFKEWKYESRKRVIHNILINWDQYPHQCWNLIISFLFDIYQEFLLENYMIKVQYLNQLSYETTSSNKKKENIVLVVILFWRKLQISLGSTTKSSIYSREGITPQPGVTQPSKRDWPPFCEITFSSRSY